MILLLLGLFEVSNILFGAICCAPRNSNLRLHHLVVLLNLFESAIELVKLFLGFEDALELLIRLLLLALVLALENFVLPLGLGAVTLHDIVIIVSPLEGGLHARQLMLNAIELHTCLLTGLANLADRLFSLT